jgi:hypothetical protein
VDLDARDRLEDGADVLDAAFEGRQAGKDLLFRGLENAVQTAEHDEREDDPPVLGLLVVPAKQIRQPPDETSMVLEPRYRSRRRFHETTVLPCFDPKGAFARGGLIGLAGTGSRSR